MPNINKMALKGLATESDLDGNQEQKAKSSALKSGGRK